LETDVAPSAIYTDNTLRRACVEVFETNEGHPHIGRICALISTVALMPGSESFVRIDPLAACESFSQSAGGLLWDKRNLREPSRT
jgi:hypothetical protein